MHFRNRKGISLVVVLLTMLLATLVGTALYKVLTYEGNRSGARLQQASAVAAAKAGLEAAKIWFAYNAIEVKGLLEAFQAERETNPDAVFALDVGASTPEASREEFRVILVDLYHNPSTSEVSVKLQVVGKGQGGAEAVLTSVLKLGGMVSVVSNFNTPMLNQVYIGDNDAIYVGGTGTDVTTPITARGSLYLTLNAKVQSPLTVEDDLVIAGKDGSQEVTAPISVGGNALFAGHMVVKSNISIGRNARFRYLEHINGSLNIGTGSDGGDFYVDSLKTTDGRTLNVNRVGTSGGNSFIGKWFEGMNGVVNSEGDLRVGSDVNHFTYNNGGSLTTNGNVWINNSSVNPAGTRFYFQGEYGFYRDGAEVPSFNGSGPTPIIANSPFYAGLNPETLVDMADDLSELHDRLNTTTKTKDQPYELQQDTLARYARSWTYWRDLAGLYCSYKSTIGLQASEWNCINDFVSLSYPDLMKGGYLYVNMSGIDNNSNVVGTGYLTRNFVFYYPAAANPLRLFGNTSDSRVIWWLPNGGSQVSIVTPSPFDRIYGIVYTGGLLDLGGSGLKVTGQILTDKNASIKSNGGAVDATFDQSVLADLASQTGLLVGPAIYQGDEVSSSTLTVTEFHPLAPSLQVRSLAEDMTTALRDTSDIMELPGGIVFMPSFVVVGQGDTRTATQLLSDRNVKVFYSQGLDNSCSYSEEPGASPPWQESRRVFFTSCKGRKTVFTVYVQPASSVDEGKGVVSFAKSYDTFEEKVGEDAHYTVRLLQTINKLSGTGRLVFDLTGSTANPGVDFTLNVTELVIPEGTSTTAAYDLSVTVPANNIPDEPDKEIRITVRSVGNTNLQVGIPSTITIRLTDLNYTSQKLTWSETDPDKRHGSFVIKPSMGVATQTSETEWLLRKNSEVVIKAVPAEFYEIEPGSWSGACAGVADTVSTCKITSMDADKSFGLAFRKKQFTLTLTPYAAVGGSIDFSPSANTVQTSGTKKILTYDAGTSVSLTAKENTNYNFMGWTGHLAGRRANPVSVIMDSNIVVGAAYATTGTNCLYTSFNTWDEGDAVWDRSVGNWSLSSSWVHGSAISGTSPGLLLYDKSIQLNGKVEAKIQAGSSSDAWKSGILLRYVDNNNYVSVGYRNAAYQQNHILFCQRTTALGAEVCTEHANHLDTASSVDLAVEALDNTFIVSVNSKVVAVVEASGHDLPGKTGLIARNTTSGRLASTFRWVDGLGCTDNNPPVLSSCRLEAMNGATADTLTISQGESFQFRATVTDPDGLYNDGVRYMVTTNDGYSMNEVQNVEYNTSSTATQKDLVYCNAGACFSQYVTTGTHKGLGLFFATLVVKDRAGAEAFCELPFKVVENAANQSPVLGDFLVNGSVYNGETIDLATSPNIVISVSGTDADNDKLSFSWTGDLGHKLETDKNTGSSSVLSASPTAGGAYKVQVTLSDGKGASVTRQLTVFLKSGVNSAPVITLCSASPMSGEVPLSVRFTAGAYDPDGDVLTYTWAGGDGFAYVGDMPRTHVFKSAANHDVQLTVSDSKGAKAVCNLTISTTTTTNRAPVNVSCKADKTSGTGGPMTVRLTGTGTDPEGGPLNFRWHFSNGEQVWGNPYNKVLGEGSYTIRGIAVDDKGAETPCAPVQINNVNTPPTVSFTVDRNTGYVPLAVKFTPAVNDKDGDDVTLSWNISGSSGCVVSDNACTFTTPGEYEVVLTATDSKGATATAKRVIYAIQNDPPVASCSASPNPAAVNVPVTWTVAASDPNDDLPLSVVWSGTEGLSGTTQNVEHTYATAGVKNASVSVSDPAGASVTATCQVRVISHLCEEPVVLTSSQTITVPTVQTCYRLGNSGSKTLSLSVQNDNNNYGAFSFRYRGAMCISTSDLVSGNGGQKNNLTLKRQEDGYTYLILRADATKAGRKLYLSFWDRADGFPACPDYP